MGLGRRGAAADGPAPMDAENDESRKHKVEEASGAGNSAPMATEKQGHVQDVGSTAQEGVGRF